MSQSNKLKLWPAWWLWKTPSLVYHTVEPRVVFKLTPKCFPRENYKESQEATQWLWPKSNQSVHALMFRAQILELERDKWLWLWTLTKTFTVTETSTVLQSQQAKQFHTWVLEEELNQLVWEFTTAQERSWLTLSKHQSLVSAQDLRERLSSSKVSVTLVTGWLSSSSRKVPSWSELLKSMEVSTTHKVSTLTISWLSRKKEIESMVTLKTVNTSNILLTNLPSIRNGILYN